MPFFYSKLTQIWHIHDFACLFSKKQLESRQYHYTWLLELHISPAILSITLKMHTYICSKMGLFHVSVNTDTIFHYTHVTEFNTYSLKINDNNNQTAKHLGKNHIHMHTVYTQYTVFNYSLILFKLKYVLCHYVK